MRKHLTPFTLIAGLTMLSFGVLLTLVLVVSRFEDTRSIQAIPVLAETRMPDGSILALNAVTSGSHHQLEVMVNRRRFDPFQSPWRWRRLNHHAAHDEVVVWLSRRDPQTGEFLDFQWWLRSEVTDAHGQKYRDSNARRQIISSRSSRGHSGTRPFDPARPSRHTADSVLVVSSTLPKFRSGKVVDLDIYNTDGDKVATLPMPNPTPQPAKEWEPEELPALRTDGELEVVLQDVRLTGRYVIRNGEQIAQARLDSELEASIDGTPTRHWNVYVRNFEDIMGNQGETWDVQLSTKEPAWKLEVQAYRRESAEFDPSEIIRFEGLTIPEHGKVDSLAKSASNAVVSVVVRAVAGGGKTKYVLSAPGSHSRSYNSGATLMAGKKNRRRVPCQIEWEERDGRITSHVDCELPHLVLDIDSHLRDHRVTLRVVDDEGQKVETHKRHAGNARIFFLEAQPGIRSIRLEVIVHEPREFEFFVKPPEPEQPNQR